MTEGQRAAQRLLETMPRERIRTHERADKPDAKTAALKRKLRGVSMPMTGEMVAEYARRKLVGEKYIVIQKALHVSARTMARLRDKAKKGGLL